MSSKKIAFLINNSFHFYDLIDSINSETSKECFIIFVIPHKINIGEVKDFFGEDSVFVLPSSHNLSGSWFSKFRTLRCYSKIIKNTLSNFPELEVFNFYTEVEPLNIVVANEFHKKFTSVILRSEGFATYVSLLNNTSPVTWKNKAKLAFMKVFVGIENSYIVGESNGAKLRLKDSLIDEVWVDRNVINNRKIRKRLVFLSGKEKNPRNLDDRSAVFISSPIYRNYINVNDYGNLLCQVFDGMGKRFSKVYVKFHPRETMEEISFQVGLMSRFSNIEILNNEENIEKLLDSWEMPPRYIFAFLSTALLNLEKKGFQPFYCFKLFPELYVLPVFKDLDMILDGLGYDGPEKICDLSCGNSGFVS